jgi:hypothetical protein
LLHTGLGEDVADLRFELLEEAKGLLVRHRALQRLGRDLTEHHSAIATLSFFLPFLIPWILKKKK